MPWCEPCGRFYNPNTVRPDGTCPTCDTVLPGVAGRPGNATRSGPATGSGPAARSARSGAGASSPDAVAKVPWHFWLLLAALGVYLGWRFMELVMLVV